MRLRTHLATLPPARLWSALRVLTCAWATSYRMHVIPTKRPCHFGRPLADDSIQHYLLCERTWHQLSLPRGQLSINIKTRLGLPELTEPFHGENGIPNSIARLSVATRTYHLTKDDDIP
eukprot:4997726-Pyramimonas_sp.AAC.1